jgi:hypothetical protein
VGTEISARVNTVGQKPKAQITSFKFSLQIFAFFQLHLKL